MRSRGKLALAVFAVITTTGIQAGAQMHSTQPYSGLQSREIKALSAEDIAALTAGRGMGFALAAELNGYPGPLHVLELADQLGLTSEQREQVKLAFQSMQSEAIPLGHKLIAAERDLDQGFANRTITPERLKAATADIGALRGELRSTHLKYHLSTAAMLSQEQILRYSELRGYTAPTSPLHTNHGQIHHQPHGSTSGSKTSD